MNIQQLLVSIDGRATLHAGDGTFLGIVSSDRNHANSICNPHGQYGSPNGFHSIRNEYGMYGGECGVFSPYNSLCVQPPIILFNGNPVAILTRNTLINSLSSHAYGFISGVPRIDPDVLFSVYGCLDLNTNNSYVSGGFVPQVTPTFNASPNNYEMALKEAEMWCDRGNKFLNSQQYEQAISAYNQALQINPYSIFEINSNIHQELTEDADFNVLQDNAIYQQLIAS